MLETLACLKRQTLFCIDKCRCNERGRARKFYAAGCSLATTHPACNAPNMHLSSSAAPLQPAGVCRAIPRPAASPLGTREAPAVDERRRRKRQRLRQACRRHRRRRRKRRKGHFDGTHSFNDFDLEIKRSNKCVHTKGQAGQNQPKFTNSV